MRIIVLDPSGNYGSKEGMGTTGWALFEDGKLKDFGRVEAKEYLTQESYWCDVIRITTGCPRPDLLVYEDYKLQGHKAKQQSGSSLDTPQLIGALRMECYRFGIKMYAQSPKDKVRVVDDILVHMGVLEKTESGRYRALGRATVIHERDAIRHGVYFNRYNKERLT